MLAGAASTDAPRRGSPRRRIAAVAALVAGGATTVVAVVAVVQNLAAGLVTVVALFLVVALVWHGAMRSGRARAALYACAALLVAGVLAVLASTGLIAELVLVLVGVIVTAFAVRTAFGQHGAAGGSWTPVSAPRAPVLLINPHSGARRAERVGLAREARARGIEPVVLGPGDDLAALARNAVARGADAIGMAGGDGSMGVVAGIASEHGVPFACVPAGTRNHFALDLGVRRDDVVGALDAFVDGVETRVDLATVNGRIFVNNASLGVYGDAVQEAGYRDAKLRTLGRTARAVLGPGASAGGIAIVDDQGREHRSPAVVLISNNPYALDRALGRSTRPRIDGGRLGVVVIGGPGGASRAWDAPDLVVDAPGSAAVAVDGEAISLPAPLRFATDPASLRVRISSRHPGVSPSGLLPPRPRTVVPRLVGIAIAR